MLGLIVTLTNSHSVQDGYYYIVLTLLVYFLRALSKISKKTILSLKVVGKHVPTKYIRFSLQAYLT